MTGITIPKNLQELSPRAFFDCSSLENIQVYTDNEKYCSIDGILYDKPITKVLYVPESISGSVTIPDGVTKINADVHKIGNAVISVTSDFYRRSALERVVLPESVTRIDEYAFAGCSSLQSITLPDTITYIGESAFQDCSSLTSIVLPSQIEKVEFRTFYNCSSLESIKIGNHVTSMDAEAFGRCTSLNKIAFCGSKSEWQKIVKPEEWDKDMEDYSMFYQEDEGCGSSMISPWSIMILVPILPFVFFRKKKENE